MYVQFYIEKNNMNVDYSSTFCSVFKGLIKMNLNENRLILIL